MNRRIGLVMALGLAAVLGLGACSSDSPPSASGGSSAPVTLTFVGADYGTSRETSSAGYWQEIADAFTDANPDIKVDVQTINWNDYDTKIKTRIQNQDYPDILQGIFYPQYATEGLLYPLDQVLTNPNAGLAVFRPGFSVDGKLYALSSTTSARAMFYNKKALADAGVTKVPTTWEELKSAAIACTNKGYIGYSMALGPQDAQAEAYLWMLGNGGGWQDANKKYAINSDQNVETFTFMKSLVDAGATNPNPATWQRADDSQKQFAAGRVCMANNGPFLTADIAKAGVLTPSDYGTVASPGKMAPISQTLGVADAIQAFKTDGTKAEAIKRFLDFATNDENQLAFAKKYALLPGTESAAATLKDDPVLGSFIRLLPNTVLYPSDANWTATVLPAVQKSIGTAVTGDPATVLGDLQKLATSS